MAGVYISFPFCSQKCTFCNFASSVSPGALQAQYLKAVLAELSAYDWPWRPETLYIGGGTPSSMEPGAFLTLLNTIPGRPWTEATLEAAPGTVTDERAKLWRETGINRVSLGVQSFVSKETRHTGRKHTAETVAAEVAVLRRAGIVNFNIDLIAGLPEQTPESWQESLQWVERLQAPHVSVYMFEIDEDSRLGKEMLHGGSRYGAQQVPPEEVVLELYESAAAFLAGIGVARYEISNFAAPGFESRHNLKYWELAPYAGFGADAHSFDGRLRRKNAEDAIDYVERYLAGKSPCVEVTDAKPDEERFFLGLRLSRGLQPSADEWRRFAAPIQKFLHQGLLERKGETLRLTERGILLSNEVFQEFV